MPNPENPLSLTPAEALRMIYNSRTTLNETALLLLIEQLLVSLRQLVEQLEPEDAVARIDLLLAQYEALDDRSLTIN